MIARFGLALSRWFRALVPDPFVLAVLLTAVTVVLALTLTGAPFPAIVDAWAGENGVWGLLRFGMQMCLILVTGHAVAASRPVARLLARLAAWPRTAGQAVWLVSAIACWLGVLNWGLGLIAGAIAARAVGDAMRRRGVPVHYPLLAAAGYLGLLVWHGGLSGSAPLKVTTAADIAELLGPGATLAPMLLDRTIFSPLNLFITGGMVLLLPILMALLHPRTNHLVETPERFTPVVAREPAPEVDATPGRLPRFLEHSPVVTAILVALLAVWAWRYYLPAAGGGSGLARLTPDTVNLTMLLVGLVLHGTPASYLRAVEGAVAGCAGIILQFPIYAGIMGVMKTTGLTALLAQSLAATGNPVLLPIATFFAACVIGLFVPSGGGQWAVQGPVALEAGLAASVAPERMVMAVAYGDEVANMLQPFWALPLLAITGVRARDIVGYSALAMIAAALWIALGFLVL